MGNQTTVGVVAAGMGLGGFLSWLIGLGILMATGVDVPTEHQTGLAAAFALLFCYMVPGGRDSVSTGATSGNGVIRKLPALLFVLSATLSAGCATFGLGGGPKPETAAQRIYALQGDYNRIAGAALAYVQSTAANPNVVEMIQLADGRAYEVITKANALAREPATPERDQLLELYAAILDRAIIELQDHLIAQGALDPAKLEMSAAVWLVLLQLLGLLRAGVQWLPEDRARADRLEAKLRQFLNEGRDPTPDELAELQAETGALHAAIQAGRPQAAG